jgi:GR25 family glycosyltransferase involved in LPS biosynthesis
MARGWESKGVEAQQHAAVNPQAKAQKITAEDMARRAERATLSLARTRALADLQKACAAAHRAMLEQAIEDLDKKIAALDGN